MLRNVRFEKSDTIHYLQSKTLIVFFKTFFLEIGSLIDTGDKVCKAVFCGQPAAGILIRTTVTQKLVIEEVKLDGTVISSGDITLGKGSDGTEF